MRSSARSRRHARSGRPDCRSGSPPRRAARVLVLSLIIRACRRIGALKGMAAISRRPWPLYAALAISLMAAACSLVNPAQAPQDKQERALQLVSAGRHADAAQLYAELAQEQPADHDNFELLS